MKSMQKRTQKKNEKSIKLQDDLLKVQTDVSALKAYAETKNHEELKARLSALEKQFENLIQNIDDESREYSKTNEECDDTIIMLTNYYNILGEQIKTIKLPTEEIRENKERQNLLLADIVSEIRSHNFFSAELLITELNDNQRIGEIVRDIYADCQGNFAILLDFAKSLTKNDLSWLVLSALHSQMVSNGHRDVLKMISITQTIEMNISKYENSYTIQLASLMNAEIITEIKTLVTDTLKEAIYMQKYKKNIKVEKLAIVLYNFDSNVSNEVMQCVGNETYPTVLAVQIADSMFSNRNISHKISGLVGLFEKLKSSNALNDQAVLKIGYFFKEVIAMSDYDTIPEKLKQHVEIAIKDLPFCAKNLIFCKTICLWSKSRNERLYAENWYHTNKRSVFTWNKNRSLSEANWYPEKQDDQICFQNTAFQMEYLHASVDLLNSRRYAYTGRPTGLLGNTIAWNVELDGDYCYLKNDLTNEYLYASKMKCSENKRRVACVFTIIPKTEAKGRAEFQWQIRSAD